MSMDFSAAVNEIMPLVKDGDKTKPFIITCDSAYRDWQVCYPAPDKADAFTVSQREHDPYTAKYFGADFGGGGMPYVYDKILCDRLRCEYYERSDDESLSGADKKRLRALIDFFEENVNSFSHTVTDYLIELDRPFRVLEKMCPFNMATDWPGWRFNEDLAADAVDRIEDAAEKLSRPKAEPVLSGKLYIPCENELFRYNEPPQKDKAAQKHTRTSKPEQPPSLLGEVREAAELAKQRKAERGNAHAPKKRGELEV